MAKRPYAKLRVDQMEEIFECSNSDPRICEALLYELKNHRKTKRALKLRKRIESTGVVDVSNPSRTTLTISAASHQVTSSNPTTTQSPESISHNSPTHVPKKATPSISKLPQSVPPKPPVTDEAENILAAWTALEVLSPQAYHRDTDLVAGQKHRIAYLDKSSLPWEQGERSRPNKKLYYELVLGSISMGPAIEQLLKVYADSHPNPPRMSGYCPLASIILDKNGCPAPDDKAVTISSFAWALPEALRGDLRSLGNWTAQEKELIDWFRKLLIQRDDDGEIIPLTKARIDALFKALVTKLELNRHEIEPPLFALRQYIWYRSKTAPETILLNSFFLEDLASARALARNNSLPRALRHYLQTERTSQQIDLLNDETGLRHLLQPALTPTGRWPGQGRFALSLLQQAAVNATNPSLMATGVLGVNGPPGTGKTTLLRDVVAARIVERAVAMSEYDRPAEAFKPTNQSVQRNGATIKMHRLDDRLKGFEMVVASSNNKAVENVSAELPGLDAIAEDADGLRYFQSVSDHVLERDTWGVVAAVLGNANNRYEFAQRFWADEERGLSTYLNHVSGVRQSVIEQSDDGQAHDRLREVVNQENPPSNPHEALTRWKQARTRFNEARQAAEAALAERQTIHLQLERFDVLTVDLEKLHAVLSDLESELRSCEGQEQVARRTSEEAVQRLADCRRNNDALLANRPGILSRLFRTARARQWQRSHKKSAASLAERQSAKSTAERKLRQAYDLLTATRDRLTLTKQNIAESESEHTRLRDALDRYREQSNVVMPDTSFFTRTHEDKQTTNVWLDQNDIRLRDNLFEASVGLHRAFVDAAAVPLRQNLAVFFPFCGTQSFGNADKDALLPELWASFFLVVPVVSTTFASVRRMFASLPTESLGWLLVDEAGQAPPQAAVGAIMRAKQAVVVGDPLQIEPVVTLPASLTEEICDQFGVDEATFNAPRASVQTLADAASQYRGTFQVGSGEREVGAPLLVHRRCDSPMFEVSNQIAYGNLMVQAKQASTTTRTLGPSRWIDIVGTPGPDKWCADEAQELIKLLTALRGAGQAADVYVVTPFVVVQYGLRDTLQKSGLLDGWVEEPYRWITEHVGTVHTVQGREADSVFFVLGAQDPSQAGARAWAGGSPNLVNVAVTRAQSSLYVIGNRQLWRSAGVFEMLDLIL